MSSRAPTRTTRRIESSGTRRKRSAALATSDVATTARPQRTSVSDTSSTTPATARPRPSSPAVAESARTSERAVCRAPRLGGPQPREPGAQDGAGQRQHREPVDQRDGETQEQGGHGDRQRLAAARDARRRLPDDAQLGGRRQLVRLCRTLTRAGRHAQWCD